jgi:hypothetical protein
MTNQELFEQAVAGNWVAESFAPRSASDGVGKFYLNGSSKGYSRFSDSIDNGQVVFYAAFDDDCNREAGYGIFNSDEMSITPVETTATLRESSYIDGDVAPIPFPNGGTITGTFNAVAFNSIWAHIWDKGNPHEVNAGQVDQDNEKLPGDSVQSALDFLISAIGSEGINLAHIDGNFTYIEIKHGPSRGFPAGDGWDGQSGSWDLSSEDSWVSGNWDGSLVGWDESSEVNWSSFDPFADLKLAELKLNHDTGDLWTRLIDDRVVKIGSKSTSGPEAPDGGQGELPGGPAAWDQITGKPDKFPPELHTHQQSQVDGLEGRLNQIEDSITDGGGFVDAPDDGKLYGRQSENWEEIIIPSSDYTLPVVLRSGVAQLPLTQDGAKLAVMTRGGELELPLAA